MREKLKSIMDVPAKASDEDVQTLYKQKEDGIHDHFELQMGNVTMPEMPTKALHPSQSTIQGHPLKKRKREKIRYHNLCCYPGCDRHDLNCKLKFLTRFPQKKAATPEKQKKDPSCQKIHSSGNYRKAWTRSPES